MKTRLTSLCDKINAAEKFRLEKLCHKLINKIASVAEWEYASGTYWWLDSESGAIRGGSNNRLVRKAFGLYTREYVESNPFLMLIIYLEGTYWYSSSHPTYLEHQKIFSTNPILKLG